MSSDVGPPITVVVVDDHPLYREGTKSAIESAEGIQVVAAVSTAEAALTECIARRPQVVLLDLNLPDKSGVEAAREINERCPGTRIIALTAHDEEAYVLAMTDAGARGYLLKSASDAELVSAIRDVAAGRSVYDTRVTGALLRRARGEPGGEGLTDRERQVLRLAAAGRTNREIGHRLNISERAVQAHLSHVYDKLGVASRTEAATAALKLGLIRLDE